MMKKLGKVKSFIITFVISLLIFEGIEHLLLDLFNIDLESYLTIGGLGFIILWGFKFHIICCIIPAGVAAFMSHRERHSCDQCNKT